MARKRSTANNRKWQKGKERKDPQEMNGKHRQRKVKERDDHKERDDKEKRRKDRQGEERKPSMEVSPTCYLNLTPDLASELAPPSANEGANMPSSIEKQTPGKVLIEEVSKTLHSGSTASHTERHTDCRGIRFQFWGSCSGRFWP